MNKFYTKNGDEGYTGLLSKGRVPKYDQRIETIGSIDEANAAISIARSSCRLLQTKSILLAIQHDLYHIMTEIAALPDNAEKFEKITGERVEWLEKQIEEISRQVPIPDQFIVPGDSSAGAAIDLARAIVRRAERHITYLYHQKKLDDRELIRYINRLSSLCFALELLENNAAGQENPTFARK